MEVALDRFSGFSGLYDKARPKPPAKLCGILLDLLGKERIGTAVDLGCGTGLSTLIWKDFADNVTGIEPNGDMLAKAREKTGIRFIQATSYDTQLPDACADIVCCSQSFHWMEPVATLAEVNRILKVGGLFAAFDCDWPVAFSVQSEIAYERLFAKVGELSAKHAGVLPKEKQWPKAKHLANLEGSAHFRYCRELLFENTERCDAGRFIGIALSQGHIQTLIKNGIGEIDGYIKDFKETVSRDAPGERNMSVGYRMVIGVK